MLALWAAGLTGREVDTPFPGLRSFLTDIEKYAGSWAIETVIKEYQGSLNAHPIDFSRALDACKAEWDVLNYLLRRDWLALNCPRQNGDFDWQFQKNNKEELGVEVKQKAALGSASHALEWWLKGLSLLPEASWMHSYCWRFQLSVTSRLPDVCFFGEAFQAHLGQVFAAIDDQLTRTEVCGSPRAIGDTGILIEPEFLEKGPSIVLSCGQDSPVRIVVEPNDYPEFIRITGDTTGYMLPKLGENEVDEIKTVLSRLRAAQQNENRSMKGLFVFVWWVPPLWEGAYDQAWMLDTCNAIAQELDLDYAAIWPRGYFETANVPWVLNNKAARELPGLAD